MPIKKPPARLGAEWRGRGATQAKLGAAAVAMPRSWCGVNEPWSPTASDLQEFLQRNKTEADAFIAPPAARSSCADPSSGEAEQVDEGELIALLHAVSPTFACARASNSLDLECTTAPSSSTPYEQTMSSAAASPSPTMELPTRAMPRCANVPKLDKQAETSNQDDAEDELKPSDLRGRITDQGSEEEVRHTQSEQATDADPASESTVVEQVHPMGAAADAVLLEQAEQSRAASELAADAINRYRTQKKRAQEVREASRAEDACAGDSAAKEKAEDSIRQYRDQKQRAMEYLDSTAEQSTATRKTDGGDVPIVDGDGSHESEMTAWRHGPDTLSDSVIIADSLDRSDVLSSERDAGVGAEHPGRAIDGVLDIGGPRNDGQSEGALMSALSAAPPPAPPPPAPPPTAPPPPAPRETPVDVAARFSKASALALAADSALSRATAPSKAALFANCDALAPLLNDDLVSVAQIACGPEARVKLGGKKRLHVSVNAVDECALDRALVMLMAILSQRSEVIDVEIRWLLRAPALPPDSILKRWQGAVEASQSSYPIKKLEAELQPDQSCVKLRLLSDGWEEWNENSAKLAPGATAVFLLSWVLCHVRYGLWPRVLNVPLRPEQANALGLDHSARLRSLSSQSGALITLLRSGGPALLLCGPRTAVGKARCHLNSWFAAVELEDE